jgi:hypothetical protein
LIVRREDERLRTICLLAQIWHRHEWFFEASAVLLHAGEGIEASSFISLTFFICERVRLENGVKRSIAYRFAKSEVVIDSFDLVVGERFRRG